MKNFVVLLLAGCVICGLGSAVQAGTLLSVLEQYGSLDGTTPTLFEDGDASIYLRWNGTTFDQIAPANVAVNDIALGWFSIQFLTYGNAQSPPTDIRGVTPGEPSGNDSLDNDAVEGILHGIVTSVATDGTVQLGNYGTGTGNPVYNGGVTTIVGAASGTSVSMTAFGGIVEMFFDDSPESLATDVTALTDASDGTSLGVLGKYSVVSVPNPDGAGTVPNQWYTINAPSGFSSSYSLSLNFKTGTTNLPPVIGNYPYGTDAYGSGSVAPNAAYGTTTAAGDNDFTGSSDGNYVVIFAPLPTAIWPAALMLLGLGFHRSRRRRNQ
jgi:hypothetical protein